MSAVASNPGTTLPLSWRLRRALLIALLLGLWAPVKVFWEMRIDSEQQSLRYHDVVVTRHLRDELGQGLTIGVLSGMRAAIADFLWLDTVTRLMNNDWFGMNRTVELVTTLQPRAPIFWEMGGWHLAWNASVDAEQNPIQPDSLKRLKAKRYWIDRGEDIFKRGVENNPTNWRLWNNLGMLHQQRLKDPESAAYYYDMASKQPGAMTYLERHPAEMYDMAGDYPKAYEAWKALYLRLTPEQRKEKQHTGERLEKEIRFHEQKLSIPKEKRIFPN